MSLPLTTILPVPFGAKVMSPLLAVAKLAEPMVAPLIVGVVKVLFVSVAVEVAETSFASPPLLGSVKVLDADSACGAPISVCA